MNEKKISFIYCVNDEQLFKESVRYIHQLTIPNGYTVEIVKIDDASSICSGYNRAMGLTDAKYKVYLHQDVFIINQNFIFDIIGLFKENEMLGMLGVVGSKTIPMSGVWWDSCQKIGQVFDSHTGKMDLLQYKNPLESYESVSAIDGLLMITQYDVPWREDLFDGWHYYDLSQCQEFIKAGFEVGVPKQSSTWCIHDCGLVNIFNGFDENKYKYLNEYKNLLFDHHPLVSILIPAFNQIKYLREALESAINQTYPNIEIIIGDDSTNNEVRDFLKPYLEKYHYITYFKNEKKEMDWGYSNFVNCYKKSKGQYVNFLNHDDILHPKKIETMMYYYLNIPNISLVTSARNPIDQTGKLLTMSGAFRRLYDNNTIVTGKELSRIVLSNLANFIGEPTTVLFKRELIDENKLFYFNGIRFKSIGDVAMWFTLLQHGNAVYISDTLSYFRIHPSQNSYRTDVHINGIISWYQLIQNSYITGIINNVDEYKEILINWLIMYVPAMKNFSGKEYDQEKDLKKSLFTSFQNAINQIY